MENECEPDKEDGILRTYEALIIFADKVNDDTANEAMDVYQAEIERQGGEALDRMVLGRRMFARPLKKRDSGLYAKVFFNLDPDKIVPLKQRCKFVDVLFRLQIRVLPGGYQKPEEQDSLSGDAAVDAADASVKEV